MKTANKYGVALGICTLASIWFSYRWVGARASVPVTQHQVHISLNQATVPELLAVISEQLKRPVLLDGSFAEARRVTITFTGGRDELLQSISHALDIEVRSGKHGAVLMCPKFLNEEGLPQSEPVQMHAVASRILRILPRGISIPTNQDWGLEIRRLGGMLSQNQVSELRKGGKIHYANLSLQQQDQLALCVFGRLFGTSRYHWASLQEATADLSKTSLILEPNTRQLLVALRNQAKADPIRLGITLRGHNP